MCGWYVIELMHITNRSSTRFVSPPGRRKVILSTAVAETSVTVEGVTAVVDAGLSRGAWYDADQGMSVLRTGRVSGASAEQRAGRAGRVQPGTCVRLWSEKAHK